jgi:hypothetical protein
MPAGNYGSYVYQPASIEDLRSVLRGNHGPWESRIGYPQNLELIETWTGMRIPLDRSETRFLAGDAALVMRLRQRVANPAAKGAPVSADPRDWEFARVRFAG